MKTVYSGKKCSVYSGKKWIVFIHGRNDYCLFREEINSIYSGKKWVGLTHGRNSWYLYVEILLQLKWSWHRVKHHLSLLRVKRRSNNTTGTTNGSGIDCTLPEHLTSHPVFSGGRVTRSLVLCVCFVDRCLSSFLLAIVLSNLLRLMDSVYHVGIVRFSLRLHGLVKSNGHRFHVRPNSKPARWLLWHCGGGVI